MRLIACWISASFVILSGIGLVDAPQRTSKSAAAESMGVDDSAWRQLVTVQIRKPSGEQLGSGVLVAKAAAGLWVASNRHVVADQGTVCVVKADRTAVAALVIPFESKQKHRELDLALIWLPHVQQGTAKVADVSEKPTAAKDLPVVTATGFPIPTSGTSIDGPTYSERPGLLVPLLMEPLQDGLDLAYTSLVEKGMSGGGVFLGRDLIGINSAHRNPLWPGQWRNAKGQLVTEQLNQKLEHVSLGLSGKQITQVIKSTSVPTAIENRLIETQCNDSTLKSANNTSKH